MKSLSRHNKRTGRYISANIQVSYTAYRAENPYLGISTLSKTMVPPLHQSNVHIKRQLWVWRTQKCTRFLGAINALGFMARQITRFHAPRKQPRKEIWEISKLLETMVPPFHQSNVSINRQLWVWRNQKCNLLLGPINALGVTSRQITRFHATRIGPTMQIWEFSTLSKIMVPHLHQSNVYIKRQLWVWRAQKCNRFLLTINALGVTARQITRFHAPRTGPRMKIC